MTLLTVFFTSAINFCITSKMEYKMEKKEIVASLLVSFFSSF